MKRYWLYCEPKTHAPILIEAKKKPSRNTIPSRGTWIVREFDGKSWMIPACPEITWGVLRKLKFVGELTYAFTFESLEEVQALCHDLFVTAEQIQRGELGEKI